MDKNNKNTEIGKAERSKREKTISLTVSQLSQIANEPKLCQLIINQINDSDGNLKGNLAFQVAKAMAKQMELEIKI